MNQKNFTCSCSRGDRRRLVSPAPEKTIGKVREVVLDEAAIASSYGGLSPMAAPS
jgi:hypothetical protein